MKKNILLILIGFLLIILAIFYFNTGKSTPKPKPSTATNTSNIFAEITNISGNTIRVEQMPTNPTSTFSAAVKAPTYEIEVTADTIISFTKNPNFFLPKTQNSEKLTFADLKIGYLVAIKTTSDTTNPQKITATGIDIFDVANKLVGSVVSVSDKTLELNVLSFNPEITDKNGNPTAQFKTYTVNIASGTEIITGANNDKEIPIKLSDIKVGSGAIILTDPNTDVSKTDSLNALKIVLLPIFLPPPTPTTSLRGDSSQVSQVTPIATQSATP